MSISPSMRPRLVVRGWLLAVVGAACWASSPLHDSWLCRAEPPSQPPTGATGEAPASPGDRPMVDWLHAHGQDPVDFVCTMLGGEQVDLLLIGETHEVADNCEFIASLLEPAYHRAGVRMLASEFTRSSANAELETLLNAEAWDDDAAVDLFRDGPWPSWGYREYVDILKAAWRLNASLPDDAEPFRVVGIDAEWRQADLLAEKNQMKRFRMVQAREEHMVSVADALLSDDEHKNKIILHAGFGHCIFVGGQRLGGRLRSTHGQRVQQLILHHDVGGGSTPSTITVRLDDLYSKVSRGAVAFRMAGSPIDELTDPDAMFARMLGPDARLSAFIEHYAILKPTTELRPVTWIPGFITEDRLAESIEVGEGLGWIEPGTISTVEEANHLYAERLQSRRAQP